MSTELTPEEVRTAARSGAWTGVTTGASLGHVQTNLVVLPAAMSDEFTAMCEANPRPLPLLEKTRPGVSNRLKVAPGADLRTDLPRYHVHRHGDVVEELTDATPVWREDMVAFLLGCSFSAENRLLAAGVRLRHLEVGNGVPMFVTNVQCQAVGRFHGPVVVSMRPIRKDQVPRATQVTAAMPLAHGAPLHVGDPSDLGIDDLEQPAWGSPIGISDDEVPVFWACGVTPQVLIRNARPDLAITHAPGHMFVTDLTDDSIMQPTA